MLNRSAHVLVISLSLMLAMAAGCTKRVANKSEQEAAEPADQASGEQAAEENKEAAEQEKPPGNEANQEAAGTGETKTGAVAQMEAKSGSNVSGTVTFTSVDGKVKVEYDLHGLSKGQHGFHVHENGDCSAPDAKSAGGHFNPTNKSHGAPGPDSHVGDMGNITTDDNGNAKGEMELATLSIDEGDPNSILGHAVVIHGKADDLKSQPSGNAGPRVACGVIKARAE